MFNVLCFHPYLFAPLILRAARSSSPVQFVFFGASFTAGQKHSNQRFFPVFRELKVGMRLKFSAFLLFAFLDREGFGKELADESEDEITKLKSRFRTSRTYQTA